MKKKKLLIISPHIDDAALSCAYVIKKKRKEFNITVLTVFTKFLKPVSKDCNLYLKNSGYSSHKLFEQDRKKEDVAAMKKMKVNFIHYKFIDGFFRKKSKKSIYEKTSDLFSGKISRNDNLLVKNLSQKIGKMQKDFDEVILPYGIGNHADHLIVRKSGEKSIEKQKIKFYLDLPYAQKVENWNLLKLASLFFKKKEIYFEKNKKNKVNIIKQYKSQHKLLYNKLSNIPHFEVIVH